MIISAGLSSYLQLVINNMPQSENGLAGGITEAKKNKIQHLHAIMKANAISVVNHRTSNQSEMNDGRTIVENEKYLYNKTAEYSHFV